MCKNLQNNFKEIGEINILDLYIDLLYVVLIVFFYSLYFCCGVFDNDIYRVLWFCFNLVWSVWVDPVALFIRYTYEGVSLYLS